MWLCMYVCLCSCLNIHIHAYTHTHYMHVHIYSCLGNSVFHLFGINHGSLPFSSLHFEKKNINSICRKFNHLFVFLYTLFFLASSFCMSGCLKLLMLFLALEFEKERNLWQFFYVVQVGVASLLFQPCWYASSKFRNRYYVIMLLIASC